MACAGAFFLPPEFSARASNVFFVGGILENHGCRQDMKEGMMTYGVIQMPWTPAFRVGSGEISQLLNKNGFARKEIYFLCICSTFVILMLILNDLTHTLIHALHGLAVREIQRKVVLFVFDLVC